MAPRKLMIIFRICISSNWGVKKYFLKVDCFIVFEAREHYLIPCKKLALRALMVKNGSENKIRTKKFVIFKFIFSCFQVF